jgi:PKD repeat protein
MRRASRASVLVLAASLAASCTVNKTTRPALSGPSELALSLTLLANPDILAQDGASQSQLVIQARDVNGQPVKNLPVHLDVSFDGTIADVGSLSSKDVVTGSDGRATVSYTAPPASFGSGNTINLVTLLVTPVGSDYGGSSPRSVNIRLVPPGIVLPPAGAPVASFYFSPTTPSALMTVNFDGSASTASGTIVSYAWDFGDGTTGSGRTVAHAYRAEGSYVVKLTVTDDRGQTASTNADLTVSAAVPLTAAFTVSSLTPKSGDTVVVNGAGSSTMPGQTIVKWEWDFGDGFNVVSGATYSHVYILGASDPATKVFPITLTITDSLNRKVSTTTTVTVSK